MLGKKIFSAGVACLFSFGAAFAGEVAPDKVVYTDEGVMESLSGMEGDPEAGRETFAARKLGNCLACHANTDLQEQLFHGEVGPPLDGVADRWSVPELRAIVANAKSVFTDETIMPGFYSLEVGVDVRKDLVGKTILTSEQVEDIVAYLATLKE